MQDDQTTVPVAPMEETVAPEVETTAAPMEEATAPEVTPEAAA
jgi:hypothetical protein